MQSVRRPTLPTLLGLFLSAVTAFGQATEVDTRHSRGVSVPSAYQLDNLDAVNLFSGNLTLALPLGIEYPVSERLAYRFTVRTNSNVWRFERITQNSTQTRETVAEPDLLLSNAGLGWQLSFGRLWAPMTPPINDSPNIWLLIEGDGSRRRFTSASLHDFIDPTGATVSYTRDGSYLRMTRLANGDREIESPDGTVRVFRAGTGVVTEIRDRFGNALAFDYSVPGTWTITDTVGRTHYVRFHQSGVELNQVAELDLETFGGARARYLFVYDTVTIPRHTKHSASDDELGNPITPTVTVPMLRSVTLPDLSQFQMTYIQSTADKRNVFEETGMIRSLTLPTLGKYEWEYFLYTFPAEQPEEPEELEPPEPWSTGEGVRFKRIFDNGGSLLGLWTYSRGDRPATQPASPPLTGAGAHEVRTWVTDPHGHDTVHYFQNDPADFGYGLPFTKLLTDGTGTRFLSRESFLGSASATSPISLRSEYLRYESDPSTFEGNERISSQRTVHHDDADRIAEVTSTDFDGFGHYRTATTGGSFGAGDVRTTFTDFNPDRGTLGQPGFSPWPTTDPWVLGTFTEQRVSEGGQSEVRQTCFDPATGVLLRERILAGPSPGANDLVRSFTYDSAGFLLREDLAGGDLQSVALGSDACTLTPPPPSHVLRHTPQHGVRARTEVLDSSRVLLTTLDYDIDPSTGLPEASRDPAGLATTYDYDLMGRRVLAEPPGEAESVTEFLKATGSARAKIVLKRTDPLPPGNELQRMEFELDGLGRLAKERQRLPSGAFNQRLTEYTAGGFTSRVSELQPSGTAGSGIRWTLYGYEPFGRVQSVTAPDNHTVSIQYQGTRTVTRTIHGVATSTTGAEQPATTTETYDRQGRLISVTQPAGAGGSPVETLYGYDPGNRLVQVSTTAEGVTQLRSFTYDGRGFLLSETHPEIDGAVLYSGYDALGNAGRKRSGQEGGGSYLSDLTFSYDPAGRILRVEETGGRLFKELFYATSNAAGDFRQGKLFQAKRHNYVPDLANPGTDFHRVVTETFSYGGAEGRLSQKRLRGTDPTGAGAASFSQSYTFDALGNVLEETYPRCLSPRCERYGPPRVVTYEYAQGSLTAIPGWVDSISYHSNGLLSQIEHVNGMTDTWSNDPDAMGRPRKIDFDGPTSMSLGNYSYDAAGNIKSIGSHLFAYDRVSRLTEADLQPLGKSQSYGFDAYGNLTSIVTTSGGVPESRPIGVSAATNRLTGAGYDASGNVTSLFTLSSLSYDPFNRVTHLTGTGVNKSFLYDTSDNRVAILDHQAQTEEWHLRGLHDKVVRSFELGSEGWSWNKDWVFRNRQLVGSSAPAQWREYHLDHLGSPRLVTGPIGLRVAEYHPFPFGEMASATEPGLAGKERRLFRYTGHERDQNCETGSCAPEGEDDLDYMMARMYSPRVGRFVGVDPILSGRPSNSQSWNRYNYALSNPINHVDPTGMYVIDCATNDQACLKNSAAFEAARQANLGRSSEIAATAKAFGDPGVENGITVAFGPVEPGAAANVIAQINFDQDIGFTLSVAVTIDPSLKGTRLEAAVGHEGQHIFDAQAFFTTLTDTGYFDLSKNLTTEQRETRAYRITNAILRTSNTPMYFKGARGPVELGRISSPQKVEKAIRLIVTGPLYANKLQTRQFPAFDYQP